MELMQLEMFVALVEEGSVRRASDRVLRTQPAVSIAIRKLEEELEVPLFDRSKRYSFRLTGAGEAFYRYAKKMLAVRREAVSDVAEIASLRAGKLLIGANESICVHLIPHFTQAFLARCPGVRLELKCLRSEGALADVKARRLDLAVVSFRPDDTELDSVFLVEDRLVLIAHPRHLLARLGRAEFEELKTEPVLMMDISRPSPWYQRVSDAFFRHKIPLHLQVDSAPIEAIKKMVRLGLGVGFVPLLSVGEEVSRGELVTVELADFAELRSVWMVRRWASESATIQAFFDIAISVATELQTKKATTGTSAKRSKIVPLHRRA